MADYFTHFSCLFDTGSPDNAQRALHIYKSLANELENNGCPPIGFEASVLDDRTNVLWLRDEVCGNPENVSAFVIRCAQALGLTGHWGFTFAHTCSRPRIAAFGGGAHVINLSTRRIQRWLNCHHWLHDLLAKADARDAAREAAAR